jgi:two-component system sensor histidine kinase/response regulator
MGNQFASLNSLNESLDFIQILDNVTDFVYYMSLDYKIIWVNRAIKEAYDVEHKEIIGRDCFDVFHSGKTICTKCPVSNIIDIGTIQECDIPLKDELIFNHKGLPVKDKDGKIIGIIIIAHNITYQRKAESAIEEAESAIEEAETAIANERTLMDILMDNIPDRIYFKDLDSKFIRVNKAMAKRHGMSDPKMLEDHTDFDLFSNEHALQAFKDEQEIIQTGTPIVNIEEKETFSDGSVTWAQTSKMPLYNKEGKIFGTFGISRDITLRKQNEEKINLYVGELKELNATKDKFFSIIAHDLKNPFSNILGFSELLRDEVRENDLDAIEQYSDLIYSSAYQTFRLLENLLDWANTHRGHMIFFPEMLSLKDIASDITENLLQFAEKKEIDLKNNITEDTMVPADKNMLKSIFRNLITNSIKFTPHNGIIELTSSVHDHNVEICIKDTGIGMSELTRNELFRIDVNHSTKGTDDEKGTGLGLLLIKEFVQKHHGEIWVESEQGKGSAFKFRLPLTTEVISGK